MYIENMTPLLVLMGIQTCILLGFTVFLIVKYFRDRRKRRKKKDMNNRIDRFLDSVQ